MLPAFFVAMYERDGQPAERVLFNIIRAKLFYPAKRLYKTENFYQVIENLSDQNLKEQEVKFGNKESRAIPATSAKSASPARTTPVRERATSKIQQKGASSHDQRGQEGQKPVKSAR